jgi:hypothetical protein
MSPVGCCTGASGHMSNFHGGRQVKSKSKSESESPNQMIFFALCAALVRACCHVVMGGQAHEPSLGSLLQNPQEIESNRAVQDSGVPGSGERARWLKFFKSWGAFQPCPALPCLALPCHACDEVNGSYCAAPRHAASVGCSVMDLGSTCSYGVSLNACVRGGLGMARAVGCMRSII